jgi:alpha-tubulin suppressor-like RCC1 family protein
MVRRSRAAVMRRLMARRLAAGLAAVALALAGIAGAGLVLLGPAAPASAGTPVSVTAGDGFSCGLMPDQSVWCWGRNTTGQLGNGTDTDSLVPVQVQALPPAIDISAGHDHVCAVDTTDQVLCWGSDAFGELGNGSTSVQQEFPQLVLGISATQVSAGDGSSCALTTSGTVDCWGDNNYGELGDGGTTDASTPQPVSGVTGVTQVADGYFHACALTASGTVDCWGDGFGGALGDGSKADSNVPVAASIENAIYVAAGDSDSCAIIAGGDLSCWGENSVGQLGVGDFTNRLLPAQVTGVTTGAEQVSLGQGFGCAIISVSGPAAFCWGDSAGYGRLGNGEFSGELPFPVQVFGLATAPTGLASGPAQISAGTNHACVAMVTEQIECWGDGTWGALGDGSQISQAIPSVTIGLPISAVYSLSAGTVTGCAVVTDLRVNCWGQDVGDGSPVSTIHTSATGVLNIPAGGVSQVSAAFGACAVVMTGGLGTEVLCWGDNSSGELGNNKTTDTTTPVKVKGLSGVVQVTTGGRHACALTKQGAVSCWGSNGNGQLGDGTTTDRHTPVAVVGLPAKAVQVEAGGRHTCALLTNGTVWCWGKGGNGELGNGSTSDSSMPVEVTGLPQVVQIAIGGTLIGGNSSCALSAAGAVFCWGWNSAGQLGDGTTSDSDVPVAVTGLSSGVLAIANDGGTACAMLLSGQVDCWGDNSVGELGDGSLGGIATTPLTVAGFTALGTSISSENSGSVCGINLAATAQCWGWNTDGQLGNGSVADSPVPTAVLGL